MKKNSLFSFLVIILLLIAVAIRSGASFKKQSSDTENVTAYTISDIQSIFPDAISFSKKKNGSISVKNSGKKEIAVLLCSADFNIHNTGYAGEVPLLIALNNQQIVSGIYLLKNQETPGFIKRLKKKKLFEAWNGTALNSLMTKQVDAISGATYSSSAIIKTVRETASAFLEIRNNANKIKWLTITRIILTFTLLSLSLNMIFRKKLKKYYWHYLFIVFIVFGIWLKQMLSLGLLHTWLTQGITIQHNIELIAILLLSVIMSILGHRKYYCNYVCPMGAMQMLISKVSPFKKRNLRLKISVITLRNIYLTFIWVTLILGFSLPLFDMEPFPAFAFSTASTIMLCAGALIVILSLFFNRPWCQLCPTGCLLDSIPTVKSKNKK